MASDTSLRVGDRRNIVFTCKYVAAGCTAQTAYDLSSATKVTLHRRRVGHSADSINTSDDPSLISVTDATSGEVTLMPDASYWNAVGSYRIYLCAVISSKDIFFPDSANIGFNVEEAF